VKKFDATSCVFRASMNDSTHENMNNIKIRNIMNELSTLFTDAIEQVNIVLFHESRLALS
jgi:hypothetical protein